MNIAQHQVTSFHCPRWKELPEIDLYMDQVVCLLEKYLLVFAEYDGEKIITSTMINNYVKQKIVTAPIKKRYTRDHLAYFFVVCIMKRILSISEIGALVSYLTKDYSIEQSYDLFCDELETALKVVFLVGAPAGAPAGGQKTGTADELSLLEAATLAFANKMYYQVGIKEITMK